jgi:hypothetical protein
MKSALRNKLSVFVQRRLQVERRGGKRVVPAHRTLCLLQAPGESEPTTATVHNLSYKGVAVLAEHEYPTGAVLRVLLVNDSHTFSVTMDMKVTRSFRNGGTHYLIAGPFTRPLQHDEIVPFIL